MECSCAKFLEFSWVKEYLHILKVYLSSDYSLIKGREITFIVEKSGGHHLNQVMEAIITNNKTNGHWVAPDLGTEATSCTRHCRQSCGT